MHDRVLRKSEKPTSVSYKSAQRSVRAETLETSETAGESLSLDVARNLGADLVSMPLFPPAGALFYAEQPGLRTLLALALILSGIALTQLRSGVRSQAG